MTPFVSSRFRLDGGSMFGVVPRVLWEKKARPDSRNRIPLNSNSLLVETSGMRILVEPGMGSRYDSGEREIYGLAGGDAVSELKAMGIDAADIDLVVVTHLHLDHAGGCVVSSDSGESLPAFANAGVVVQRAEYDEAFSPHPLSAGSYRRPDFAPLAERGALQLVDGPIEVAPGLTVEPTGGHTSGHQVLRIRSGGQEAVFTGDLVPTTAHLRLNWLMAWDVDARTAYAQKASLLKECARGEVLVFTAHDPQVAAARVRDLGRGSYGVLEDSVIEAVPRSPGGFEPFAE